MSTRESPSVAFRTLATVLMTLAGALLSSVAAVAAQSEPAAHAPRTDVTDVTDKIIVSGASGQLGRAVVQDLLARGVPAKNLILVSRTPDSLQDFAKLGASTRFGDFSKPESLPAAYAGGKRMLLISIGFSNVPRPQAQKRAIDAAVAAGVRQIAYTSYVSIGGGDYSGIAADHYQTEENLKKSGAQWTFLRNSIYMDQLLPQAAKMLAEGRAVVPANEFKIGYVTRADCAAAAAAAISTPGHENKAYDITGSELIGIRDIAAAASAATGKPIAVSDADPNAPPVRTFGSASTARVSTAVKDMTGHAPTTLSMLLQANKSALLGSGK